MTPSSFWYISHPIRSFCVCSDRLASLQTSFVTLDEALKVTNRRVNALENVTIPKIEGVLAYIDRELDELEREGEYSSLKTDSMGRNASSKSTPHSHQTVIIFVDFTRLKLVKGKKEQTLKEEAKMKAASAVAPGKENDADITSAFDAGDDEDVVF